MINSFLKLLSIISKIGVEELAAAQERRYVSQLNRLGILIGSMIFLLIIPSFFMLPASWFMVLVTGSFPLLLAPVYILNHKRRYTAARIYFVVLSLLTIVSTSLWMGGEAFNHIYLLSVGVGTFYIFPTRQTRLAVYFSSLAVVLLLGLELFFLWNPFVGRFTSLEQEITHFLSLLGFSLMLCLMALQNFLNLNRAEENARYEHDRAETVLKKMFPKHISDQLKSQSDVVIAERFENVSIMFIDIVGFTEFATQCSPENLINFLDDIFGDFDRIARECHVEKIKSIGDAYLLASGLTHLAEGKDQDTLVREQTNAMVDCGLKILEHLKHRKYQLGPQQIKIGVRIGIHTGPVVAGVFGDQKFSYDVWGDTVNTAQRMESHSQTGFFHATQSVVAIIGDDFIYQSKGKTIIKGKGSMETFYIMSRQHEDFGEPHKEAS